MVLCQIYYVSSFYQILSSTNGSNSTGKPKDIIDLASLQSVHKHTYYILIPIFKLETTDFRSPFQRKEIFLL